MPALKKILCALDFSEQSKMVARYAIEIAKMAKASITVIYVSPALTQYTGFHVPPNTIDSFVGEVVSCAEAEMKNFVEAYFQEVDTRPLVVVGYPAEEILSYADAEAIDMIVMGTRGRKGLDLFLFGSVAEKVVKSAKCPVLTVPPLEDIE